jgi:hypothetical protein
MATKTIRNVFFFQPSEIYNYSFICEWTYLRKGHTHPLLVDISR